MDAPYSNREINDAFNDIKDSLKRIENQTTKTNGRVGSLEDSRNTFRGWIAGFSVSVFVIMSLIVYIFNLRLAEVSNRVNQVDSYQN